MTHPLGGGSGGGVLSGGGTRRLCVALFAGVGLKYESPIVLRGGVQAQARPPKYEVSTGPRLEVRRPRTLDMTRTRAVRAPSLRSAASHMCASGALAAPSKCAIYIYSAFF